jgi:Ca2+-binding RTX toxin-like protein
MPITGYSVTLHVYIPSLGIGIPHAFVTITTPNSDPVTIGYYPVATNVYAPGVVKNDGIAQDGISIHPETYQKTFDVSAGQVQSMLAYAANIANNPGTYGLFGNQCTAFARDVLAAGGVTPSGIAALVGPAPYPFNLELAFATTPINQVQAWRTDSSQIPNLIQSIYNGIDQNPAHLQDYINNLKITPLDLNGGYWFGAQLDNIQWNSLVGDSLTSNGLSQQASILATNLVPINVAGSIPVGLLSFQATTYSVAVNGLNQIGVVSGAFVDTAGNVLVIGAQGTMQLNKDGTSLVVSESGGAITLDQTKVDSASGVIISHIAQVNSIDGNGQPIYTYKDLLNPNTTDASIVPDVIVQGTVELTGSIQVASNPAADQLGSFITQLEQQQILKDQAISQVVQDIGNQYLSNPQFDTATGSGLAVSADGKTIDTTYAFSNGTTLTSTTIIGTTVDANGAVQTSSSTGYTIRAPDGSVHSAVVDGQGNPIRDGSGSPVMGASIADASAANYSNEGRMSPIGSDPSNPVTAELAAQQADAIASAAQQAAADAAAAQQAVAAAAAAQQAATDAAAVQQAAADAAAAQQASTDAAAAQQAAADAAAAQQAASDAAAAQQAAANAADAAATQAASDAAAAAAAGDSSGGDGGPIIIDINGNGVDVRTSSSSTAWFDWSGTGTLQHSAWVGAGSAFVAEDMNGDGKITYGDEIAFARRTSQIDTDLQALLQLHDTNGDGVVDAKDVGFNKLLLWNDANGNGVSDAGELQTFAQAGLTSISGSRRVVDYSIGGVQVSAMASATFVQNGQAIEHKVADVSLTIDPTTVVLNADGSKTITMGDGQHLVAGTTALNLTLGSYIVGATGSAQVDYIQARHAATLDGGAGNDILVGASGDDVLIGGAGSDILQGGAGNDSLYIDAQDNPLLIQGGSGFDVAIVQGAVGVTLDLGRSTLEAAYGGDGNDILYTSTPGAVILDGGAGNDTLTGNAGNDTLDGGAGTDILIGGKGEDTYVFGRGYSRDSVQDWDNNPTARDTVKLLAGVATSDLTFTRSGNDLVLSINGTTDQLCMQSWFLSPEYRVEQLAFADGTVLDLTSAYQGANDLVGNSAITASAIALAAPVTGAINAAGDEDWYKVSLQAGHLYRFDMQCIDPVSGSLMTPDSTLYDSNGVAVEYCRLDFGGVSKLNFAPNVSGTYYLSAHAAWWYGATTTGNFALSATEWGLGVIGGDGNDVLDGRNGTTYMCGGSGNDTYLVDDSTDVVRDVASNLQVVSSNGGGALGNDGSTLYGARTLSNNGRYAVFESYANNLVVGDTNGVEDVFLKDLQTGAVQRISTSTDGQEGNDGSYWANISEDGRYVLFQSNASNLVVGDTNGVTDLFLKDMQTGTLQRISTAADGAESNDSVSDASISADCRYIVFSSWASNLVANDTNNSCDVFIKDLQTGEIQRISTSTAGGQGDGDSARKNPPIFSQDGRYVIFSSDAGNLVAGDTNGMTDVYRKDLQTGNIQLVSASASGVIGDADSGSHYSVSASADGRFIAFESEATNLVPGGANIDPWGSQMVDLYLKDMQTGAIRCVSTDENGVRGNGWSEAPALSADGRYLVFKSDATNLMPYDINRNCDMYIKDLQTGVVQSLSVNSKSMQGSGALGIPTITVDGHSIVFESAAALTSGDLNTVSDVFRVSNPFTTDAGIDTVQASISYTLGDGIENLTLTGSGAINGTGNALNNVMVGNSAANILNGGAGDDTYQFSAGGGADIVVDSSGTDQLVLGAGILVSGVTASRSGSQVKLIISPSDSVTFDETSPGQYAVESVVFADNTVWLAADIRQMTNSAPTGAITVTGMATQNQALTVANTLADADGMGTIAYQWQSSTNGTTWTTISGANASSFSLTEAQVGKQMRAVASYTDGRGTAESVASAATVAVANVNDAPTGSVTIAGTATQNQILTVANTLADADGLGTIAYQWQSSTNGTAWTAITGATASSFTLAEAQVGKQVRAVASYTDGHGTAESVASAATVAVANVNDAPTGSVAIAGTATQNQTLTVANTLADADGLGTISYQWQSSTNGTAWTAISGATASGFSLTETQVGKQVRVVASYTDGHGTAESVASAATVAVANVNDAPTGSVTIAGTATQNQILTAANTLADLDGLGPVAYQWQSSTNGTTWTAISGATAISFSLTEAQVGKQVRAVASYTDGHGTAESVASAATVAVVNVNDAPTGSVTIVGTATQNQILTAANTLADADGLGVISYQWQSSTDGVTWAAISGATASSFTLAEAQVGKQVRAVASYTDGHGTAESVASSATIAVVNVNDAPTGSVTITGTATQNQTLTAANTLADLDGLGTIAYQWQSSTNGTTWTAISGATASSYVLSATEVGKQVRVVASYTDGHGTAESIASLASVAVTSGVNRVVGTTGNDTLSGTTGADQMEGLAGNDTYLVNNIGDVVVEALNAGTDLVNASVSYTLSANVENLTLTGTTAINGTGNDLVNTLTGNSAANVLDGGLGADTMVGGAGNDTYYVDNIGDVTTEAASAGTDTVMSSITWTLGTNLENLTLSGTSAINATGNTLANVLTGNAGDNVLSGGTGADTMIGGAGNDTYVVDNIGDVVTEISAGGTDLVQSSVTYTLLANVENLTLTGTTAINGVGNTSDNVLTGNSAANTLTGGAGNDTLNGGAGNDTMVGGVGNDTYVVDSTSDIVTELVGEGTDTIQASVTLTALSANVENLTLTGTTALNGTGNTLNNVLTGNSANNTLTGAAGNDTLDGGAGVDTLAGGVGNDSYIMGRGYGADVVQENDATVGNIDVLQFMSGVTNDQIWLRQVGNNLELDIIGTSDSMTVSNWYLGSQYHVEQIKTSDGKTLTDTNVQALVQAMAAFAPPASGQTTLPANYATTLSPVLAANWK